MRVWEPAVVSPLSGPRSSSVLTSGLAMALGAPCILAVEGGDIDLGRVLRLVGMFGTAIDAEVLHLLAAERAARQHPFHRLLQRALGLLALENLRRGALLDAARIAGVPVIDLVGALVAGEHDLV